MLGPLPPPPRDEARRTSAQQGRAGFRAGLRAVAPALLATGPWGLVTGVAMVKVGLTPWEALAMTLLVFAGSAQLAALPLMAVGAPIWVVLLTATVVNLRFVIFSAGLYPYFRRFSLGRRLALGYITSDVGFALCLSRWTAAEIGQPAPARGTPEQIGFFLGIAAGNWTAWQSMTVVGILLGAQIPPSWGLDYAAILALISLTVPMVSGWPALVGLLVAAAVAIAAAAAPLKLGLVVAVIAGIVAAMATELLLEAGPARRGRLRSAAPERPPPADNGGKER